MEKMIQIFSEVHDPRHHSYTEHKLPNIMILLMGAVICGITELADMMTYFNSKKDFYRDNFQIENLPSKSTFSRILSVLDSESVAEAILKAITAEPEAIGEILAADGKAIKGTGEYGKSHSFLQILSVYAVEDGLTIAQKALETSKKTNEIPVLREIIGDLNLEGKTITADAMHCQKETCAAVQSKKGDYVFGLKNNQKDFYEEVELFLTDPINAKDITVFETLDYNGGRIEKRTCRASENIGWITNADQWKGLASIFSVTRETTLKGETTIETGYYISSRPGNAEELLRISRSHWGIESMHWMLDVIWNEDNNNLTSENGQKVMNVLRKLALFAHKKYLLNLSGKKPSVKQNVLQALLNDSVCFDILKGFQN
jgi:predicted transposase YbfD/YdcC